MITYNLRLFQTRLKQARTEQGLTQPQLAIKIGRPVAMISHWENGQLPSPENLVRLAEGLQKTIGWLCGQSHVDGLPPRRRPLLSEAERETLGLLAKGYTPLEIAAERGVTHHTVRVQIASAHIKAKPHRWPVSQSTKK